MKRYLLFIVINLSYKLVCADVAPNPIFVNSIIPSDTVRIQMVSEIVNAFVYKNSSIVECTFVLKNFSGKTNLSVGFPIMSFYHWFPKENWKPENENFKVWVENKKIDDFERFIPKYILDKNERFNELQAEFSKDWKRIYPALKAKYPQTTVEEKIKFDIILSATFDSLPYESERIALMEEMSVLVDYDKTPWYLWKMSFDSLELKTVTLRYSVPCGYGGRGSYRDFKYILNTGAGWYNKIGKAEINVKIMNFKLSDIDSINTKNYMIDQKKKCVKWELFDIEPTISDNIYIRYTLRKKEKTQKNKS